MHRAETHIADINELLQRFIKKTTYRVVADLNREPGTVCWVARGKQPFPHDEFAPVIGDILHNMRDALDLAVSALVRIETGADEEAEFITRDTLQKFESALDQRAKRYSWPTKLTDILKTRVQPYKGGRGQMLRVLHKLAVMDKHRLIVPTVFGAGFFHTEVTGQHFVLHVGPPEPIKDGAVVKRAPVVDLPGIKVNQEASVSLTIAFDQRCDLLAGAQVLDGIVRMFNAVQEALEHLRQCLPA